jgi:type VI secretion system protein ImpL
MIAAVWQRLRAAQARLGLVLTLGYVVLALWAAGLGVAAYQLGEWRQELTRTLMQLNADAHFRARLQSREAVDPEWYRRKALALLSASDALQKNAQWTVLIPGSWHAVDDLEEQLQSRLAYEFNDIVVETLRRELYARASRLTGVPLVQGSELATGADCQSPVPQVLDRRLTAAAEDLPEFVAVAQYVMNVERLDEAVQSFLSLQSSGGQPEQLRKLVAYALGKELPGALAGAVRMFHGSEEVSIQPALMQSQLQWASRCSLMKGMAALHGRLLNTNDLFALEQGLIERSAGLFEASARPVPFERTLERYRAVHALLDDQNTLLAKGRNDWMRQGTLQLGPVYTEVLKRIERTRLLGPDTLQQLQNQSGAAFAEFRRQFELAFGRHLQPGIVWVDNENRFGLSSERAALRQGLAALLKASFMSDEAMPPGARHQKDTATLAKVLQEARTLAEERAKVATEVLPMFPPQAQPVVARVVDTRVSELIYQRAFRTLKASLPTDPRTPIDATAFRQQREQVLALQSVLKETGGHWLGDRLVATLDGELVRRLASLQEDWKQQPLQDAKIDNFAWWQGEPLPLAQALGAEGAVPPTFSRTAARLDVMVQQARSLMDLGSPGLLQDPAAARWLQLRSELERYTARAGDSSLLRLERYLAGLGPDLKRDNCAERLAANAPAAAHDDDIAQRHQQLHQALTHRCHELRAQAAAAVPLAP